MAAVLALGLVASTVAWLGLAPGAGATGTQFTWSPLTVRPSPPPLAFASSAYDSDNNTFVIFGGITASGALSNDTWVWNGNAWTDYPGSQTQAPPARSQAVMAFDSDLHQLILFGGVGAQNQTYGDTWAWNGLSWYQELSPLNPGPRYGAAFSPDSRGHLVLFGGAARSDTSSPGTTPTDGSTTTTTRPATVVEDLADTWLWTSAGWVRSQSPGPSAREGAAATLDATTHQVILFSGWTTARTGAITALADTWSWSGSSWSKLAPKSSPPGRAYAAAYPEPTARGVAVYGGHTGRSVLADTWIWAAGNWSPAATHGAPPARAGAATAFLSSLDEAVLFGGATPGNHVLGDLWALTSGVPAPFVPTTSTTIAGPVNRPVPHPRATPSPSPARSKPTSPVTAPTVKIPSSRFGESPGQDWLEVNRHSAHRGQSVILTGSGFQPGSAVTITFHSRPYDLGTVTVGPDGQFVASVSIPPTAPGGTHHFEATGPQASGQMASVTAAIVVLGVNGPGGPSPAETAALIVIAVVLPAGAWLGMGGAGWWRRRRAGPAAG